MINCLKMWPLSTGLSNNMGKAIQSAGLFYCFVFCVLVYSVYGPMGHDVDTLVEFLRAMMVPYMWKLDPAVVPIPFRDEVGH